MTTLCHNIKNSFSCKGGGWQKRRLLAAGAQLDLQGTLNDYLVYIVRLADSDRDPLEADLLEGP